MNLNFMKKALKKAKEAFLKDEVPVGCVIVKDGEVIASGRNMREEKQSAVKHAEIVAIEAACKKLKSWRLCGCEIYVTLEPCAMCAGAIINARIDKLYYGASDERGGACGSVYSITTDGTQNHTAETVGGVMGGECASLLSEFFKSKRKSID